jgi:hypothetical protein
MDLDMTKVLLRYARGASSSSAADFHRRRGVSDIAKSITLEARHLVISGLVGLRLVSY